MAFSSTICKFNIHIIKHKIAPFSHGLKLYDQKLGDKNSTKQIKRRDFILRTTKFATIGSIVSVLNLGGEKPDYLGVQKNQQSLALCPATNNCISTSENVADIMHYAPPWTYNPEDRKDRVSKEEAIEELIDVIETTIIPPEYFIPRIVERTEDYIRVEYESPILGLVDDVEFWFRPDKDSTVEYRSASRVGDYDFEVNRKRIKALRLELEKRGWASQDAMQIPHQI